MASPSRVVLVTGCSSGIGRATAIRLARDGWSVFASARHVEAIADLIPLGCRVLALDVTSEESMRAAVAHVEAAHGAVSVLVNNAGFSQSGAIETVPIEQVRAQFETNVFGLARLTQLVLPGMRRQRWGKIVNISSMGGKLVFPGGGYYHATKYALEAISDALRFEVQGFGVKVIVIEPGLVRSEFPTTAVMAMKTASTDEGTRDDVYAVFREAVARATQESYIKGPVAPLVASPEQVADVISGAVSSERPRTRYTVGASATVFLMLRRLLGDRLWDRFLSRTYPMPGTER